MVQCAQPVNVAAMQKEFVKKGVWIRPFGKLIYIMPPYIIGESDLRQLTAAISRVLERDGEK